MLAAKANLIICDSTLLTLMVANYYGESIAPLKSTFSLYLPIIEPAGLSQLTLTLLIKWNAFEIIGCYLRVTALEATNVSYITELL